MGDGALHSATRPHHQILRLSASPEGKPNFTASVLGQGEGGISIDNVSLAYQPEHEEHLEQVTRVCGAQLDKAAPRLAGLR